LSRPSGGCIPNHLNQFRRLLGLFRSSFRLGNQRLGVGNAFAAFSHRVFAAFVGCYVHVLSLVVGFGSLKFRAIFLRFLGIVVQFETAAFLLRFLLNFS